MPNILKMSNIDHIQFVSQKFQNKHVRLV